MNPNDSDDDMSLEEGLVDCIWSGENKAAISTLQEMSSCDLTNSISGRTLLHVAADFDNVTIAQYLIDRRCKVDAMDNNGNTPLILACQLDNMAVIKVLVEAKSSVLISNNEGKSAADIVFGGTEFKIHILDIVLKRVKEECSNDSLRTAKELLRIGCSLTRATRLKDVAITKYMLENGYNVNDQDHRLNGWTPLHQALVFKDNENAKLLIDHGADVNAEDGHGFRLLGYAECFEMLVILLNKGAKVVDDDGTLIAYSLFYNWGREVVEMLIERYNLRDFSIKDRRGTTLFHHIVANEVFDPVEILQKHYNYRFDVNKKDHEGVTALYNAVKAGNVGTVEFLLKKGAKFIPKDIYHDEVDCAVAPHIWKKNRKDREKILMLLLQYGADVQSTCRDNRGNEYFTLGCALIHDHFVIVKIILARLALIEDLGGEIKNVYRNKIEHHAMCKKYFDFCKRTIEKLKKTVIKRQVTLYDFLTCSEESLVKFARSERFVATVQSMMYRKRRSNLYYYKVLRSRVRKAVEIVDLRQNLFCYMSFLIPALYGQQIVIEKIVEYIIDDILRLMARQPTFKCMINNE